MKKSEIEAILSKALLPELAPDGFEYFKPTKWFARKVGELSQIISWSYYTSTPGQTVVPMLGVRSEAVLSIFKKVNVIQPADEKFRRTLSIDIWRLGRTRQQGEFRVTSEAEALHAAAQIGALVRSDALKFFEDCTTVADIDRIYNSEPNSPHARLYSVDNWTRSATAVIVARLANNARYDELVAFYRAALEAVAAESLPQFDSLIELLRDVSPAG